jgi:NAD(P)H dehydrogenase (quinone)
VFLQNPFFSNWAAESIAKNGTIRLPFGTGRTSPIDARDCGGGDRGYPGKSSRSHWQGYELTGPQSQDMRGVAGEFSNALGRTITYVDVPLEQWRDQELRGRNFPDHLFEHLLDHGPPSCRQPL